MSTYRFFKFHIMTVLLRYWEFIFCAHACNENTDILMVSTSNIIIYYCMFSMLNPLGLLISSFSPYLNFHNTFDLKFFHLIHTHPSRTWQFLFFFLGSECQDFMWSSAAGDIYTYLSSTNCKFYSCYQW